MFLLDLSLPTLAENLALDEALLLEAEAGDGAEVLRFWEHPQLAVVLGAGGQFAVDVNEAACQADGVELARRSSGGGTVLLGTGCLLYSLVLRYDRAPELRDVTASYRWIMGRMKTVFQVLHPEVEVAGISDLSIHGRKFSGNAQQRKRFHVLHHGTLLYGFDLPAVARYLQMPDKQPAYRAGRGHLDFVCNLETEAVTLKSLLVKEWDAAATNPAVPLERMRELWAEKYQREEWVRRR